MPPCIVELIWLFLEFSVKTRYRFVHLAVFAVIPARGTAAVKSRAGVQGVHPQNTVSQRPAWATKEGAAKNWNL